jgi:predicted TPR repeat methyltransferase
MKKYYDIDAAIDALEKALATARNDAAGYADMGQTEDSIHADGVADGLAQALEIVRNEPDGHGIFF